MFELSYLYDLAAGRHDPLQIGPVPERVRVHLGCRLGFVYLSKVTYDKIRRKHRHVTMFDMLLLPLVLSDGRYVCDRDGEVAVAYHDRFARKDYLAALHVTQDQYELWLTTFHRTGTNQVERVMRRGPAL